MNHYMLSRAEKFLKILVGLGLAALIIIIFSQQIVLSSLDLGRHLKNGQLVWSDPGLLFTNFYSYTEGARAFVNHHWFSGVVLDAVYEVFSWPGLSILNIILTLATFFLAFRLAWRRAGFYLSAVLSLPVIFLLSERTDIRPEAFSYFLIFLVWIIIDQARRDHNYRRLYWLLPLFILWVNLHIYFFIGLLLLGTAAAAEFLPPLFRTGWRERPGGLGSRERWRAAWRAAWPWTRILFWSILVGLINPNTWRGLLYPILILRDYGYTIAENQTIFYLGHLMLDPNFGIFKFLLGLLIISWLVRWFITKKIDLWETFLMIFFAAAALFASRNLTMFGLAALILISANLAWLRPLWLRFSWPEWWSLRRAQLMVSSILLIIIISGGIYLLYDAGAIAGGGGEHRFMRQALGWSLADDQSGVFQFFKTNHLSGPIFNNYDVGSALIFWLYPPEKVFVDNRPEAYGAGFFNDIYKPMQTDPAVWQKIDDQYKFKAILFAYTDSTPWAQQFLQRILHDPDWALVYFDRYDILLLNKKRNDPALVNKLSLNNQAFRTRWRELAAGPASLPESFNLANLAVLANQPDLAQALYQELIFRYPTDGQVYDAIGNLYAGSGSAADLNLAIFYLERALVYGYRLPGVYDQLGLTDWALGNYQKAESDWQAALGYDRGDASALYYLKQIKDLRAAGKLPEE